MFLLLDLWQLHILTTFSGLSSPEFRIAVLGGVYSARETPADLIHCPKFTMQLTDALTDACQHNRSSLLACKLNGTSLIQHVWQSFQYIRYRATERVRCMDGALLDKQKTICVCPANLTVERYEDSSQRSFDDDGLFSAGGQSQSRQIDIHRAGPV